MCNEIVLSKGEKKPAAKDLISKCFTSEILYFCGDGVVSDSLQKLNT